MTDHNRTPETDSVFNPGQANWIREKADRQLDEDQRALLLALAQLEVEVGHPLSDEEWQALESLGGQLEGFDASEIASAIHQMVNRPADPDRQISWSELRKHRE